MVFGWIGGYYTFTRHLSTSLEGKWVPPPLIFLQILGKHFIDMLLQGKNQVKCSISRYKHFIQSCMLCLFYYLYCIKIVLYTYMYLHRTLITSWQRWTKFTNRCIHTYMYVCACHVHVELQVHSAVKGVYTLDIVNLTTSASWWFDQLENGALCSS